MGKVFRVFDFPFLFTYPICIGRHMIIFPNSHRFNIQWKSSEKIAFTTFSIHRYNFDFQQYKALWKLIYERAFSLNIIRNTQSGENANYLHYIMRKRNINNFQNVYTSKRAVHHNQNEVVNLTTSESRRFE